MTKDINQWNNSMSCVDEISTDDLDDVLDTLEMTDDEFDAYVKEKCMDKYDWDEQDDEYGYSGNMPCDTWGMCAGTSCSHYWQCNQYRRK